jgi:L1 cell adhesion molecule like protein
VSIANSDTAFSFTSSSDTTNTELTANTPPAISTIPMFKIVGDNVDKTVRPRHETSESHTKSLHYFHSYAALDRSIIMNLDNTVPSMPDMKNLDVNVVLPSEDDKTLLNTNMSTLFARIVRKNFPFFKKHVQQIERHIPHPYSKEMSQKSEVVCILL